MLLLALAAVWILSLLTVMAAYVRAARRPPVRAVADLARMRVVPPYAPKSSNSAVVALRPRDYLRRNGDPAVPAVTAIPHDGPGPHHRRRVDPREPRGRPRADPLAQLSARTSVR